MKDVVSTLARFARSRIAAELGAPDAKTETLDETCQRLGASFVTVRWHDGRLQGCIGTLEPRRSLADDVAHNAVAAAFRDPRGLPLELSDLEALEIEVSVLSRLERVSFDGSERGALAAMCVGDGLVLVHGTRRGTFLPQMWESIPTREEFLSELKRKARLAPDFWSPDIELHRYSVSKASG